MDTEDVHADIRAIAARLGVLEQARDSPRPRDPRVDLIDGTTRELALQIKRVDSCVKAINELQKRIGQSEDLALEQAGQWNDFRHSTEKALAAIAHRLEAMPTTQPEAVKGKPRRAEQTADQAKLAALEARVAAMAAAQPTQAANARRPEQTAEQAKIAALEARLAALTAAAAQTPATPRRRRVHEPTPDPSDEDDEDGDEDDDDDASLGSDVIGAGATELFNIADWPWASRQEISAKLTALEEHLVDEYGDDVATAKYVKAHLKSLRALARETHQSGVTVIVGRRREALQEALWKVHASALHAAGVADFTEVMTRLNKRRAAELAGVSSPFAKAVAKAPAPKKKATKPPPKGAKGKGDGTDKAQSAPASKEGKQKQGGDKGQL